MQIGIDGIALQFPHYRAGIYYYTQRVLEQLFALDSNNDYRIYLSGSRTAKREAVDSFIAPHPHVHCLQSKIPQRFLPATDFRPGIQDLPTQPVQKVRGYNP